MIKYSQKPANKDLINIKTLMDEITDIYSDFYITKQNLRLMIKDNKELFFECLNKGDRVIWDEQFGILFISGFSDKASRIYIRPLCRSKESAERLVKYLKWKSPNVDLWAKIKRNNPIKNILLKKSNNFKFVSLRGKEILLCRPKIKKENIHADQNPHKN